MKHIYILLLILLPMSIWGQVKPHQAPLNPDFVNQTDKTGYIHAPFKIKHNSIKTKDSQVLPARFDLRDVNGESFVPDIRNQNPWGTCWAFACYASLESAWKKMGDATFTDLSEGNMAKCNGYEIDVDSGGNQYMSTAYLTRLAGPVYESSDPQANTGLPGCPSLDKNIDIPAYINDVLWLGDDPSLTKSIIMTYGAVATSMKADFSSSYYNSSDFTFFYNGEKSIDHGVSIIGWDDNKQVTGGTAGTPTTTGAWIIRNSWGTGAQDGGYFYASYEDTHIGRETELYNGKTPVTEIDTLFDYAKLGAITAYNGGDDSSDFAYAAVKYNASTNYYITHIGAAILSEGTSIDITLCKSFDGEHFSDTIAHTSDLFCTYAGYQKIEFPAVVSKGDFYLILRYQTPNETYPLPAEVIIEDYSNPEIEEGKLWVSPDALQWTAGGLNTEYEFDLAVKIMAQHTKEVQPYFSPNKTTACLGQTITFQNKTIGEADSFLWSFPEDTFITYSAEESITLSFNNTGNQEVTIVAYKDSKTYTFTRQNAIEIVAQIYPNITVIDAADFYSKGKAITLIGSGGDHYQWYAEGYLTGESGRSITFSPDVDSLWVTMEASMGQCFETDSVLLMMIEVPYDDIEDALLLTMDVPVENISNAYASVQSLEPTPTLGSCDSQNSWCAEGGLQNSIWFKFAAPATGKSTITSTGFDNQLALYDASATGTWQDIMSGNPANYSILAANDDYHTVDYSAKITQVTGLEPNKFYWIQMDGSAGGSVGKVRITVRSTETRISATQDLPFEVINTNNEFRLTAQDLQEAEVSIINSIGQVVYTATMNSGSITTSGEQFTNGFHLIAIKSQNFNHVYKVIISEHWQLSINE
ncbi:MAG: lectin like domain-containing protein [Bacteroidales bacterium]|jgi:C1A family cysteine protease|nr:lectin like domain-containing protein [Bacteroidales bacterium]